MRKVLAWILAVLLLTSCWPTTPNTPLSPETPGTSGSLPGGVPIEQVTHEQAVSHFQARLRAHAERVVNTDQSLVDSYFQAADDGRFEAMRVALANAATVDLDRALIIGAVAGLVTATGSTTFASLTPEEFPQLVADVQGIAIRLTPLELTDLPPPELRLQPDSPYYLADSFGLPGSPGAHRAEILPFTASELPSLWNGAAALVLYTSKDPDAYLVVTSQPLDGKGLAQVRLEAQLAVAREFQYALNAAAQAGAMLDALLVPKEGGGTGYRIQGGLGADDLLAIGRGAIEIQSGKAFEERPPLQDFAKNFSDGLAESLVAAVDKVTAGPTIQRVYVTPTSMPGSISEATYQRLISSNALRAADGLVKGIAFSAAQSAFILATKVVLGDSQTANILVKTAELLPNVGGAVSAGKLAYEYHLLLPMEAARYEGKARKADLAASIIRRTRIRDQRRRLEEEYARQQALAQDELEYQAMRAEVAQRQDLQRIDITGPSAVGRDNPPPEFASREAAEAFLAQHGYYDYAIAVKASNPSAVPMAAYFTLASARNRILPGGHPLRRIYRWFESDQSTSDTLSVDAYSMKGTKYSSSIRLSSSPEVVLVAGASEAGYVDGPAKTARFNFPGQLAFDRQGNLLIADSGNKRIRRLGRDGVVTTIAGNGVLPKTADATAVANTDALSTAIGGLGAISVDNDGNIYFIGLSAFSYDATWGFTTYKYHVFRLSTANRISYVQEGVHVAVNPLTNQPRIQTAGSYRYFGERFDAAGTRYLLGDNSPTTGYHRLPALMTFGPDGTQKTETLNASSFANLLGNLGGPPIWILSLAVDARRNAYVATPNAINQVTPEGAVSRFAGRWDGSKLEGRRDEVYMDLPKGMAVGPDGNLYVADGHHIRRIALD